MGYIPYDTKKPHILNTAIPVCHCLILIHSVVMRMFAAKVDLELKDGSFSNNMYLNVISFGLPAGYFLMLAWSRGRSHSKGALDDKNGVNLSTGNAPSSIFLRTGYEHSNLILSFACERLGTKNLKAGLIKSSRNVLIAFTFFYVVQFFIVFNSIKQMHEGKKPVYERFGNEKLDFIVQSVVLATSTINTIAIAFISPLYIKFYSSVFSYLLDELVYFITTQKHTVGEDWGNHSKNEVLMLIIQEHKLIDSLLRVTCKKVEKFIAFAIGMLSAVMLMIIFKYAIAGGDDDSTNRTQNGVQLFAFTTCFIVTMFFLHMLARITTKCELLPQAVNRLTAYVQSADESELVTNMCTTNFLLNSKMAWRLFGLRVTNVLVIRMLYVVGSLGVFVLTKVGLGQSDTSASNN